MRIVAINERGLRIGEDHHHAKLTNMEAELIRKLHEEEGFSYRALAAKFEVSKSLVARICRYEKRNHSPARFKSVIE
ncbi:hypothetical protein [Cupriavidus metallidurans]|uniref:hypothetical protein n=1 Tax=Cupriavidus metallidurans TaxID=119219 RepID=UPI00076363A7|nr:hypothetical protein [Cupriavidus metallidurans]KWW37668.1 hypothetical protein AU374_01435 [Cupriavidus metallidurans]